MSAPLPCAGTRAASYYDILGVPAGADEQEIRRAFRGLARQYHPDAGAGSSAERFRQISEAYEALLKASAPQPPGAAPQPENPPDVYVWRAPGSELSIALPLGVMVSLELHAREGLRSRPPQETEIGGLLLGRVESHNAGTRTVLIEDYEPVPSSYRDGPWYHLAGSDRRGLVRAIGQWRARLGGPLSVVGFYRSHIRERLALDDEDCSLIHTYFADLDNVVLLVQLRPGDSSAGAFFYWENDEMRTDACHQEFPFNPWELLSPEPPNGMSGARQAAPLEEETPEPEEAPVPAEEPAPRPLFQIPARGKRDWVAQAGWLGMAAVGLVILAVGLAELRSPERGGGKAAEARPLAGLGLRVERQGNDLRVSWNRAASEIVGAQRGVLSIADGVVQKHWSLDAVQLRYGSVVYFPLGNDVSFRLEVFDGRASASDLVRVLAAENLGQPRPRAFSNAATRAGQRFERPAVPAAVKTEDWFAAGRTARPAFVPPQRARAAGQLMLEPPQWNQGAPAVRLPELPMGARLLAVPAPATPVAGGRRPVDGPAPAVADPDLPPGTVGKDDYVPPAPIRRVPPALSPHSEVRRLLVEDMSIDVKVSIDAAGNVVAVNPVIEKRSGLTSYLNELASSAARMWKFRPARRNNRPVPAEMVLRFQFGPQTGTR